MRHRGYNYITLLFCPATIEYKQIYPTDKYVGRRKQIFTTTTMNVILVVV